MYQRMVLSNSFIALLFRNLILYLQKKLQCPLCKTHFINVIISKRIYYEQTQQPQSPQITADATTAYQLDNNSSSFQKAYFDQETSISDDNKNISIEKSRNHKKQPKFKITKELIRLDIVMKNVTNQSLGISGQTQSSSSSSSSAMSMHQIQNLSNILTNQNRPPIQLNAHQPRIIFSQQNHLNQQQIQNELLIEQEKIDKILPQLQQNVQNNQTLQQNLHPDYIIQLIKELSNTDTSQQNQNQISNQAQLMLRLHLSNTRFQLLGYLYSSLFKSDFALGVGSHDPLYQPHNSQQIEQNQLKILNQIPCQSWLQLNNILTSQLLEQTINQISFTAKFFNSQNPPSNYQSLETNLQLQQGQHQL
ncbi:zinc finger protein, putative (macronuclear) [Tetrahymena thermophila SB210]|uniref:Zinc finger protein, putative n=1 Tax=Tetrahymena thermophila (strain SB210) TaxID=312017 RepID=Q23YU7_TETTS|nr:zinc finger protein, putative [Tetrahymena thermophila SB210]EAS01708.2 zinc finger protein, putative [Tetrahymena thermophila SB210]|eukprot:XP_001021953.2 zinc finger protein, putative [Tetrahymena thermophila SB210]